MATGVMHSSKSRRSHAYNGEVIVLDDLPLVRSSKRKVHEEKIVTNDSGLDTDDDDDTVINYKIDHTKIKYIDRVTISTIVAPSNQLPNERKEILLPIKKSFATNMKPDKNTMKAKTRDCGRDMRDIPDVLTKLINKQSISVSQINNGRQFPVDFHKYKRQHDVYKANNLTYKNGHKTHNEIKTNGKTVANYSNQNHEIKRSQCYTNGIKNHSERQKNAVTAYYSDRHKEMKEGLLIKNDFKNHKDIRINGKKLRTSSKYEEFNRKNEKNGLKTHKEINNPFGSITHPFITLQ